MRVEVTRGDQSLTLQIHVQVSVNPTENANKVKIAVLNLFLSDLRYLDPLFRFVAFLVLGIIAVFISLFYSKLKRFLATGEPEDEGLNGRDGAQKLK